VRAGTDKCELSFKPNAQPSFTASKTGVGPSIIVILSSIVPPIYHKRDFLNLAKIYPIFLLKLDEKPPRAKLELVSAQSANRNFRHFVIYNIKTL
jgi:hypothetical protein